MTKEEARLLAEAFYTVTAEKWQAKKEEWAEQHKKARKIIFCFFVVLGLFFIYGLTFWN